MNWKLCILGANSAVPTIDRYPSGQVLQTGIDSILIDCGEGSQLRMLEYGIKKSRINTILISHMHGDHIFGLPGLLTSYNLYGRTSPLHIFGPQGIKSYIEFMIGITSHDFKYPINIQEITNVTPVNIVNNTAMDIVAFPLRHRIPTYGYRIREKINRKYLSKEKVTELNLSDQDIKILLNGGSIRIQDQPYTLKHIERHPTPRSYAYVSDTAYFKECADFIGPVRLLYHESTFLGSDQELATERYHSTATEAAKTALDAQAKHLLLGHYSSRYKNIKVFQEEAEKTFKPVSLARSGKMFVIPLEDNIEILDLNESNQFGS